MIRLYDTAKRTKVPLEPRQPGKLGIYVCGPTVYDYCHVGHARCYVAFDVIVRYLRYRGFEVTYVRNVTDVDDKIIARANQRGEDPIALSARFTATFHSDMQRLGALPPDREPRVSDHIPEIIALIQEIIDQGIAYQVDGDVYFAVDQLATYGELSHRNLDDLLAGARVDVDERKRNALDFALWKASKPGEPSWDSPFGKGRPGWHIECSAMSGKYLGSAFDIHGGGMDLIFPHHENEVAQTKSVRGAESFARYWMHNGFITIDKEKMSKSGGNFFTIRDVCSRHEPEALRLFLLGTQYRNPINFEIEVTGDGAAATKSATEITRELTQDADASHVPDSVRFASLEEAEQRLAYTYKTLERLDEALGAGKDVGAGDVLPPVDTFVERFDAALDDDFNTAAAAGLCSEVLSLANKLLDQPKSAPKDVRRRTLQELRSALRHVERLLGVFGQDPSAFLIRRREKLCAARGIDPGAVEARITARSEARAQKDFARADVLRQELVDLGVELMDGPSGTKWGIVD